MDEEKKQNKTSTNKTMLKGVSIGVAGTLVFTFAINSVFAGSSYLSINKKLSSIDNILENKYVDELTDEQKDEMVENIYRGYVAGVGDKYTTYMDSQTYAEFLESTNGQYAGIGSSVANDTTDNKVTIIAPFPNSPAANAGLESGDKILSVEGVEVFGTDLDDAVSKLKGKPGSDVTFEVLKKSTNETETITLTRQNIDILTVSHEVIDNNIGYIRISSFDGVTTEQYLEALSDLQSKNISGLILDLRDNPGGRLDVVCDIADTLLPEGTIVYTEDKNGNREDLYSDASMLGIPLVVLVNEYSASASEVLTCAIQDYGVGTIIGEQTYGKGVVQTLYPLRDNSAIKVTISRYYSPNGTSIDGVGATPDIVVDFDEMENGPAYYLPENEDPQLEKAVEVLSGNN